MSLSATVSQIEPVHTPCAPIASAAAICEPCAMPPAANTGAGATFSITCGHSTIELISPVWPPASVPWAMTMSTPMARCFSAWRALLASAATRMSCSCAVSTMSFGGGPSAFTRRRGECCSAISICGRAVASVQPSRWCGFWSPSDGQRRDVVLRQHLLDEVAVLGRDHLLELVLEVFGLEAFGELHLGRHHEVDAVRLAVDVLVDPLQLDLELFGREVQRAQHAHAAGATHRGDHVAAM